MLVCWVSAFLGGSLLLLDILEFTDRFAIPESICFFSIVIEHYAFVDLLEFLGIRMLDKLT